MIPNQVSDKESVVDRLVAAPLLRSLIATDPRVVALSFGPKKLFTFNFVWRDDHLLARVSRAHVEDARKQYARCVQPKA